MVAMLWLAVAAVGCSQAAPAAQMTGGSSTGQGERPRTSKTLRLGSIKEPKEGILFAGTSTGAQDPALTFHAGLTVFDEQGVLQPRLAAKIPAVEDGDWKVGPDGLMEVTWQLRPGIRWQDGTPVSVDDIQLGLRVIQDDEVPIARAAWSKMISEIRKVDDTAFTVVWRQANVFANESGPSDLALLPSHLIGRLYEGGDKSAFINNLYWTQEFVGVGPYRIKEWVLGSHLSATAVDDYMLGRPKVDELVFRFYTETPSLLSAMLAGEIDVIPVGALKAEEAMTIKQAWEPRGAGTSIITWNGLRVLYFQYRDPNAPWVRDVRVRRALTHMQDRQTLVETLKGGLTVVGDTLPTPDDPLYQRIEQKGLPKYNYDLRAAQQLMEQAGWAKGPNGIYQNAQGQPFTIEVRTIVVAPEALQEILAEADQFKAAGLESPIFQVNRTAANRQELRAKSEGVFANRLGDTPDVLSAFHSSQIASEANRWTAQNIGGYSNPVWDRMYDQYIGTFEVGRRQDQLADMLKMAADEVVWIPMWYELGALNLAYRKGVRGVLPSRPIQQESMWNVHLWELD